MNRITLLRLQSKIDSVLEFRDPDDKDGTSGMGLGTAAVGTGIGVGATGAAYAAGANKMYGRTLGGAVKDAKFDFQNFTNGGAGRIAQTIGTGASSIAAKGSNLVKNVIAKARGLKLSARPTNILELNDKLDGVIELDSIFREDMPGGNKRRLIGVLAANDGQKGKATREVMADSAKHTLKHVAVGTAAGAAVGALTHGKIRKASGLPFTRTQTAVLGGSAGMFGGSLTGGATGPIITDKKYDKYFK